VDVRVLLVLYLLEICLLRWLSAIVDLLYILWKTASEDPMDTQDKLWGELLLILPTSIRF
jgi:hypothetical protein